MTDTKASILTSRMSGVRPSAKRRLLDLSPAKDVYLLYDETTMSVDMKKSFNSSMDAVKDYLTENPTSKKFFVRTPEAKIERFVVRDKEPVKIDDYQPEMSVSEIQNCHTWLWANPMMGNIDSIPQDIQSCFRVGIDETLNEVALGEMSRASITAYRQLSNVLEDGKKGATEIDWPKNKEGWEPKHHHIASANYRGRLASSTYLEGQMMLHARHMDLQDKEQRAIAARYKPVSYATDPENDGKIEQIQAALRWMHREHVHDRSKYFSNVPSWIRGEVGNALEDARDMILQGGNTYRTIENAKLVEGLQAVIDGGDFNPKKTHWVVVDHEHFFTHHLEDMEQELMDELVERNHIPPFEPKGISSVVKNLKSKFSMLR